MEAPDRLPANSENATGPIAQSIVVGFRALYVAVIILALFWVTTGVREIASDSQVVVRRFGRIVRAQQAGLLITWPRPIDQVQTLPGPQRQLSQDVSALLAPSDSYQNVVGAGSPDDTSSDPGVTQRIGAYLTGDGNVVLLTASLIYRIKDPIAYALQESHVGPALDRLFRATAVHITAGRNLNDFLVTSTDLSDTNQNLDALRSEVRESLLRTMNDRLRELDAAGADLGVEIEQINLTPSLPPVAKAAFDKVLVATQTAASDMDMARTEAERQRQGASSEAEQLVSAAEATASETVSKASVDTASILALVSDEKTLQGRDILLLREWRVRVADIMGRTEHKQIVSPKNPVGVLLPGKQP